jgi:hypothetical protein
MTIECIAASAKCGDWTVFLVEIVECIELHDLMQGPPKPRFRTWHAHAEHVGGTDLAPGWRICPYPNRAKAIDECIRLVKLINWGRSGWTQEQVDAFSSLTP